MHSKQRKTLAKLFAHPVSHDIPWRDIEHLFEGLGAELSEASGGRIKVRLKDQEATFPRPKHKKQVSDTSEVLSMRRFLEVAGVSPEESDSPEPAPQAAPANVCRLLVSTAHEARIYDAEPDPSSKQPERRPDTRHRRWRLTNHRVIERASEDGGQGESRYFDAIATALTGGSQILVLEYGDRAPTEQAALIKYLADHHPELFNYVVGVDTIAEPTEHQLLERARDVFQP